MTPNPINTPATITKIQITLEDMPSDPYITPLHPIENLEVRVARDKDPYNLIPLQMPSTP